MDGPTDAMRFWPAPDVLPGLVSSTVGYRDFRTPQDVHRGLPSPYLTFVLSLADPIVTGSSRNAAHGPEAWRTRIIVSGLQQGPAYIVPDDHQEGLQLAIHPLASRAVFGLPAAELVPLVTDGADVLGSGAERLRSRLVELPTWSARFAELRGYLRARTADSGRPAPPRPEVVEAWRWLARRRGATSLAGLAQHVCLSPRQLSTVFAREIGATPKQVAGLMRFDHARQLVAAGHNLTAVAGRTGFADHAHLDRDFHRYAGISPTGWLAEERRNIQAGGHHNGEDWGP